jgi:hypothetical protein
LIQTITKAKKTTTDENRPVQERKDRKPKIAISTPQHQPTKARRLLRAV